MRDGSTTESKWSAKLCNEMRKCNALVFRIVGQFRGASGMPDALIIHAGMVCLLEFKGEKTKITELQKHTIVDINKKGGFAVVARRTVIKGERGAIDGIVKISITNEEDRLWATCANNGKELLNTLHMIEDGR